MHNKYHLIESIGFSVRVQNVLASMPIHDLRDLTELSERDLYRLPNLGKKSVTEIREVLTGYGLSLGMKFAAQENSPKDSVQKAKTTVDEWIHLFARQRVPFLEKASLAGSAAASNHLGRLYLEGVGVGQCYRKARVLFIHATRRGCRLGFANLALIYRIGYGVRRSEKKAARLMRRYNNAGEML